MTKEAFDLVRQAMAAIEMYRGFYGSGQQSQERFTEILQILRTQAQHANAEHGGKKFLLAFADALEIANRSGEYIPLSER